MKAPQVPHRPSAYAPAIAAPILLGVLTLAFAIDANDLWPRRTTLDPGAWCQLLGNVAGTLICTYLLTSYLLCAAARLPGSLGHRARRLGEAVLPLLVRRGCAVILGFSALSVLAGGAHALPPVAAASSTHVGGALEGSDTASLPDPAVAAPRRHPASAASSAATTPGASPAPSAPSASPSSSSPPATAPGVPSSPGAQPTTVVVHAGDTLWAIAEASLPQPTTSARVAVEWPRWFAANRAVLDDPNLLFPGQVLTAPQPLPTEP